MENVDFSANFADNKAEEKGLNLLDIRTPVTVKEFSETLKHRILDGEIDPLKTGIVLKRMAKISENLLKDKDVKETIEDAFSAYGSNDVHVFGATLKNAVIYTAFDFSDCKDPVWNSLDDLEKQVKELKKKREDFLKTLIQDEKKMATHTEDGDLDFSLGTKPKSEIIEDTYALATIPNGEIVEIYPPKKYQTRGIKYMKV